MKQIKINPDFTERYLGQLGELTLKGGNIHFFEKQLLINLKTVLHGLPVDVRLGAGRLYVSCQKEASCAVEYALDHLIGITGWAKVHAISKDINSITDSVTELAKQARAEGAKTFKIEARREDKSFTLNSYQICVQAASGAYDNGILKVDVHNPDVIITVEVRDECYVYSAKKKTCRGLPVGVSGKGLLLLSGGLDSPVAGYRMMRRGMKVECVYFHSYPYTSEEAQKKVEDLANILSSYGVETHLNVISFTDVQKVIKKKAPVAFSTLMLRVCMIKVSNLLAERIGADCIITGESLAQVASQTVENLAVTEHFAQKPLLRPLIGMDKEEIIDTAVQIGTYNTSILPYEDCCVLFSPKHPVLHASIEEAESIYNDMQVDELIRKAYEEREIIHFCAKDFYTEKQMPILKE